MEHEKNPAQTDPIQHVKKLVRLRTAHEGVFTKLENLDLIFEAEALLATIKAKSCMRQRYDAQFELLIKDENKSGVTRRN